MSRIANSGNTSKPQKATLMPYRPGAKAPSGSQTTGTWAHLTGKGQLNRWLSQRNTKEVGTYE